MALTVTLVCFLVVGLAAQIDAAPSSDKPRKDEPVVDNGVGIVKPMKEDFHGYNYAECVLVNNNALNMESARKNNINGVVSLKQKKSGQGPVYVNITMKGMDPDGSVQHGLHVHVYGDLTNGCNSAGGHFNPAGREHGAPADAERHVGDWGNIERSADGTVDLMMTDNLASLAGGAHFIVGRAIVLHEKTDDLGKGGDEGSLRTGNAGSRLACCVIGLTGDKEW